MPPAIAFLASIAPALTAAGAAATVGDTIYNATQSGGGGGAPSDAGNQAATLQAQQDAAQAAQQKQQAISAQVANAQEKTGGALTTPGLTDLASVLAGYAGQAGPSGGVSPQPQGATSGTPGLQDALNQLAPATSNPVAASFSGGS